MARRNWTDEEKAAALELLADGSKSFYEVRDATEVPVGTLHRWATEAGLERSDEKTLAATKRRTLRLSEKRQALAEEFLDRVEDLLGRMDEPHVVGYTKKGEAVVFPMGASADCKNYMTAAAISLDKFRLEMGEHTQATRSDTGSPRDRVKDRVDELEAKRQQRSA